MRDRLNPLIMFARVYRYAGKILQGNVRVASEYRNIVASILRVASRDADIFARAAYIEGLLGYSPNSITRQYSRNFSEAREAIEKGKYDQNPIARVLVVEKGMSPADALRMVSERDTGVGRALLRGVGKIIKEPVRGLEAEDIAASVGVGFSPITGGPLRYGQGKGAYYHLGVTSPGKISIGGIMKALQLEGANRAKDVLRGTNELERTQTSLDAPISGDDLTGMLQDIVSQEEPVGRATFIELADSLINDPGTMRIIDNEIRGSLGGELQEAIWKEIKINPDLLEIKSSGIGVKGQALAQAVSRALGREVSRPAAAKNFKQKVLPAIMFALKDDSVARRALKKKEIYDIIYEETRSRRQPGKTRMRQKSVSGPAGPVRIIDPALYDTLSKMASRVAARYASQNRQAFQMPAHMARKHKVALDWAKNNWQKFYDSMSERFDADGLAKALSAAIGDRNAWRDVDHWVWNIAYDAERNVQRGVFY